MCLFQHVHQSVFYPLPVYPGPAGHSVVWIVLPFIPFPLITTVFLNVFYLVLPSSALFSSPPAPSLYPPLVSCLPLSCSLLPCPCLLFLSLSIPCFSLLTSCCSPPRQIDVPSLAPHLCGPPIISFEQVLINDIHRLMNNSPKRERGRRGREGREGRGGEQRGSR